MLKKLKNLVSNSIFIYVHFDYLAFLNLLAWKNRIKIRENPI